MKRCQRLGLLESGCHVSMPAMRSVVLIARHGAAHSKPQSPMAPDHTSACTLSRSWHHHACMRGPCSTSHVCYASSLNNSSAQPPQLQHGKELIDVLAPLPLLFPALLGAAAVAVFRAASGAAAGASLPMWCIAVCLVPTVIVHIAVPLVDYLLGEQPSSIKVGQHQFRACSSHMICASACGLHGVPVCCMERTTHYCTCWCVILIHVCVPELTIDMADHAVVYTFCMEPAVHRAALQWHHHSN